MESNQERIAPSSPFPYFFPSLLLPHQPSHRIEEDEKMDAILERLMEEHYCPHDFACYKKGLDNFPNLKIIIPGKIYACTSPNTIYCPHSYPFGMEYLCNCPIIEHLTGDRINHVLHD